MKIRIPLPIHNLQSSSRRERRGPRPLSSRKSAGAGPNPLALDPSRTGPLVRRLTAELRRRFARLRLAVADLIEREDAFGLTPPLLDPFAVNVFCPTGSGGGVDPSCSPGQGSAQLSQALGALDREIRDAGQPVREAAVGALRKAARVLGSLGLKGLTALSLKATDRWVFEQVVNAQAAAAGLPAGSLALKVAAWGLGKAWLAARGTLRKRLATNAEERLPSPEREALENLLRQLAEAVGLPSPSSQDVDRLLGPAPSSESSRPTTSFSLNQRWRFRTRADQLAAFQAWLKERFARELLGRDEEALWIRYVEEGLRLGAGRAWEDVTKVRRVRFRPGQGLFTQDSKAEFLRQAFAQPVAVDKVKLLAGRAFDELEGVTAAMALRLQRTLADGLVQGKGPRELARLLAAEVDGFGRSRALTLARTELVRAHAEGQLLALERLGVERVGVAVEWAVTKGRDGKPDAKVCPLCRPLDGVVLSLQEAAGLLPRHPS